MNAMTFVERKASGYSAASFLPRHNGLAGRDLYFVPKRICESHPTGLGSNPLLQPKLAIGEPDDAYEHEADRVAEAVLRMPESTVQLKPG